MILRDMRDIWDHRPRTHGKELVQVEKYQDLTREIKRVCGVKNVVPVVVGAL